MASRFPARNLSTLTAIRTLTVKVSLRNYYRPQDATVYLEGIWGEQNNVERKRADRYFHPWHESTGRLARLLRRCKSRGSFVFQDVSSTSLGVPTMATRSRNVGYALPTAAGTRCFRVLRRPFLYLLRPSLCVLNARLTGSKRGASLKKLPYPNPTWGIPGHLNGGIPPGKTT